MEVSRTASTILSIGSYIIFNEIIIPPSNCIMYNQNTGITTLIGQGLYKITFSCDLSSSAVTSVASLVITIDGTPVPKSAMTVTSTAANDTYNVSKTIEVYVPIRGYASQVGVMDNATTNETISNAVLIVDKVA